MATYLKVSKEGDSKMTPEYIQGKLFSFANAAHKYHLDTKSFEQHKGLQKLYEGLNDFKDSISESLMGYTGKRIGRIKIDEVMPYTENEPKDLCKEIMDFAYEVYEWAGDQHYCDVENKAQDLSGLASKVNYLLTLT